MTRLLDVFLLTRVFRTTTLIFFPGCGNICARTADLPSQAGPNPGVQQTSRPGHVLLHQKCCSDICVAMMLEDGRFQSKLVHWTVLFWRSWFFVAEIQSLSLTLLRTVIWTPTECLRHAFWTEVPGSVPELLNLWFWHRRGWWQQRLIGYKGMMASMRYKF